MSCGIFEVGFVGPHFFEEDMLAVTVHFERYAKLCVVATGRGFWDQHSRNKKHGITARTSNVPIKNFREMFFSNNLHWHARSPDLTVVVPSCYRVISYAKLTVV